jgi:DNA adenine methylase
VNKKIANEKLKIKKPTPFVHWVGGKNQFLPFLNSILPEKFDRYVELFVGGGSLLFSLQSKKALINDINRELIASYLVIKSSPRELITSLEKCKQKHSKDFHGRIKLYIPKNDLEVATRFIYLNKASFGGLYRLNSKGEFNVGFNLKEKITLFEPDNILAVSKYLNENEVEICNQDYKELLDKIQKDDFLFVDPPYDVDRQGGFTGYTTDKFSQKDQEELLKFLKECEKKGAKWLLANHATDFIKDLYKDYGNCQIVRTGNQAMTSRYNEKGNMGTAQEIFISNYKTELFNKNYLTTKEENIWQNKLKVKI